MNGERHQDGVQCLGYSPILQMRKLSSVRRSSLAHRIRGLTGLEWGPDHREIWSDVYQNLNFTGDFNSPLCQLSVSLSLEGRVGVGNPGPLCPSNAAEMTRLRVTTPSGMTPPSGMPHASSRPHSCQRAIPSSRSPRAWGGSMASIISRV